MHNWPVATYCYDDCNLHTSVYRSPSETDFISNRTHSVESQPAIEDLSSRDSGSSDSDTPTMENSQQDELARLFAMQMNVSQLPIIANDNFYTTFQPILPKVATPPLRRSALPIDFASTHYTPTAHVRPESSTGSPPPPSPPPTYQESCMSVEMAHTLRQHSIDPAALSPSQVQLFSNADYEQKLRLLELWRISPPSYRATTDDAAHVWSVPTNMEKEETDARLRYEQQVQHTDYSANTYSPSAAAHTVYFHEAEPYMVSGYVPHSDPVYAASSGLWKAPEYVATIDVDRMDAMEE